MIGLRQCKVCGAYMTQYIKAVCGDYKLIYSCSCGYSTADECYLVDANTHTNKDMELEYTNHT